MTVEASATATLLESIQMNKTVSHLLVLLFTVALTGSALAKKDNKRNYYYMITEECEIAVPNDLKIVAIDLSSHGIHFMTDYKMVLKTLFSFKSAAIYNRKKDSYQKIIRLTRSSGSRLEEEKTIGFLKYLKLSDELTLKTLKNRYYLFGKSFIFKYSGGTDEEMEYIINHCLETAKKSDE